MTNNVYINGSLFFNTAVFEKWSDATCIALSQSSRDWIFVSSGLTSMYFTTFPNAVLCLLVYKTNITRIF